MVKWLLEIANSMPISENDSLKIGDEVEIVETRPLIKVKALARSCYDCIDLQKFV